MNNKFFNDAVIGNRKMTVSFSKTGELLRMFYPTSDYKQFFELFHAGIKVNDSALIYLHNDINNVYNQYYVEDTNILKTEIVNTYFNIKVTQTDFIPIKENLLVKNYKFENKSNIELNVDLLFYSKLLTNYNNDTCGFVKNDTLIQYNHDYSMCIFSKQKLLNKQINGSSNRIMEGTIGGKDYIGLSSDSSISYSIGKIMPGEEKDINVYIYINDNKDKCLLNELDNEIERIRKIDMKKEYENTKKYWRKYVKEHSKITLNQSSINNKLENIYIRSILLFPLLINEETGGISAGIEVDEAKTKCGRYSYCWTRDAVFVTKALDILGMEKETEKFYKNFCKMTQSKNGMWEQRFYTDGRLAPCWGYQIDETASVVYGVYTHYEKVKDKKFLKETLKMCENACVFLEKYVNDILSGEKKMQVSYDLWEEYEGITFYSLSSIFSAFDAMLKIYSEVKELLENNRLKIEAITKQEKELDRLQREIKEYVLKNLYDEEKKCFVRNSKDKKLDISMLGAIVPFKMLSPKEKKVLNTVERINMTLRTYTGGYIRYEDDKYMGGYNPWPLANLWMAYYNLEVGEKKKAIENFEFVVNSMSEHGFLGEQVNNEVKKPAWVIGLTWSHAMYIIVLEKLSKLGLI